MGRPHRSSGKSATFPSPPKSSRDETLVVIELWRVGVGGKFGGWSGRKGVYGKKKGCFGTEKGAE